MKKLLLLILTVLVSVASFAQNVPPPNLNRGPGPPPGLPVDQYLIGLFAVGIIIAFAFHKRLSRN
jgi:hypothetical protein